MFVTLIYLSPSEQHPLILICTTIATTAWKKPNVPLSHSSLFSLNECILPSWTSVFTSSAICHEAFFMFYLQARRFCLCSFLQYEFSWNENLCFCVGTTYIDVKCLNYTACLKKMWHNMSSQFLFMSFLFSFLFILNVKNAEKMRSVNLDAQIHIKLSYA